MNRFSEFFLIPRNHFKFKSIKNIDKYQIDNKYQIIDFFWKDNEKKFKLQQSLTFNPITFETEFQIKLFKNKTILIYGNWKELKYYYHFLKHKGYKVYLIK